MVDGTSHSGAVHTNNIQSSKYSAPCRAGAGGKAIAMRTISRPKIIGAISPPPYAQSSPPKPDAEASQPPPAAHRDDSLATNPSAGLVTEDHPSKRRRGGWGLAGVFVVVAGLAWLACPTAAFAQTNTIFISSVAGDNVVTASEKWNGFKITGHTGNQSNIPVVVTFGTETWNTTSTTLIDGNYWWLVSVPGKSSYITDGDNQTVNAEATFSGGIKLSHSRSFNVDLTLTLNVDDVTGDNTINRSEHTNNFAVTGNTGTDSGVTVTVTIGGTALTSVTSAIAVGATEATWSVTVPANADYITETSVELSVTATKLNYTDAPSVSRTLTVDLTAPTVSYMEPSNLEVGKAIMAMVPTKSEDIFSYAISGGSLPPGLSLNGTTGEISGVPTTVTPNMQTVGVLATDGAGNVDRPQITFPAVDGPEPGVTVSARAGLIVPEGGSAQYTLVLDTEPMHEVTIEVSLGPASDTDLTATPDELVFSVSNWSKAQTVTVSAAEDVDGIAGIGNILHNVVSTDTIYDRIPVGAVKVTEGDNDPIAVIVSPTALSVPEGGSASYTVMLGTQPEEDVTVEATRDQRSDTDLTVTSVTDTDAKFNSVTLLFTDLSWHTEQTVTVSAAEDDADEVDGVAVFSHSVATNGGDYDSLDVDSVTATEADNEKVVTVAIQTDVSAPVRGAFEVMIIFSEAVTGFDQSEIAVTNGSVTDFSGSAPTYKAEITPSKSGEVIVEVAANVVEYGVGNGNRAAEPLVFEADLYPVVSFQEESYTAREGGEMVAVTVKLSEGWDEELVIPIQVTRPETTEVADYTLDGLEEWDAQEGAGTLTFPAEETERTFRIAAHHDGDGDDEKVELGFGELPEAVMAGDPAVATVTFEDKGLVALKVSFAQAKYQVMEGQRADIEMKVTPTADRRVEVPLVVAPQGGATDEDYRGVPAKVVFEEGVSQGTISVEVLADEVNDPGEAIVLSFGELPEAVSAGDPSSTQVEFRQDRTAEQFSQTLEVMLAVIARSTAESARTAIEGRFERHRRLRRMGSSGGAMQASKPGTSEAARAGALAGVGSGSINDAGSRGEEGPVEPGAWGVAKARPATGWGWDLESQQRGTQGSWLRNFSLGGLGSMFGSGQGYAGVSTGSGMGPSGTGLPVAWGGQPGYGQNRFQGTGTRDSSLRPGSAGLSGMRGRESNLGSMLSRTSFELSLGEQEKEKKKSWVPVLWGQGDLQRFNGNLTRIGMNYRGGLKAAHVGLDLYASKQVLAGLSFMHSWGTMDYSDDGIEGVLWSRMNTAHPYLYWQPSERFSAWVIGGLGMGQVDVNEPGRTHDFKADFRMLSGGVRSVLAKRGNTELGVIVDSFTARLGTQALEDIGRVTGEATRTRMMLEMVHDKALSAGRSLSVKAEFGGRHDEGDADRGSGAEAGLRIGFLDAASGVDVAMLGRVLVVHESDYRDWGLGVQASWDPGEKQRGLQLSMMSSRGRDGGGRTTLWNNAHAVTRPVGMGAMGMGSQSRMESEVAYGGLKALGLPGLLTPYSRLRWAGQGRALAWGTAWSLPPRSQLALPLMLELEALRRENRTGPADLAVLVRMSIPF